MLIDENAWYYYLFLLQTYTCTYKVINSNIASSTLAHQRGFTVSGHFSNEKKTHALSLSGDVYKSQKKH